MNLELMMQVEQFQDLGDFFFFLPSVELQKGDVDSKFSPPLPRLRVGKG